MGWEEHLVDLFEDLEHQAQALADAERAPELADRSRAEYRSVTLAGRLMASLERDVALGVEGAGRLEGRLERVGSGWCLLSGVGGQDWLVRLAALGSVVGASERAVPEVAWSRVATLGLGAALRRLAQEEQRCLVHLRDGDRIDGVLERVGSDFVEVRVPVGRVTLVAFTALAAVQSRG